MGDSFLTGTLIHFSGWKLGDTVNLEKEQEFSGAIQRNEDGKNQTLLLTFRTCSRISAWHWLSEPR